MLLLKDRSRIHENYDLFNVDGWIFSMKNCNKIYGGEKLLSLLDGKQQIFFDAEKKWKFYGWKFAKYFQQKYEKHVTLGIFIDFNLSCSLWLSINVFTSSDIIKSYSKDPS